MGILPGRSGRLRNLWWARLTFLCSCLANGSFFKVLIPDIGNCMEEFDFFLMKTAQHGTVNKVTEMMSIWHTDLQWLWYMWLCMSRIKTKGGREFSFFITCSWQIQSEVPFSFLYLIFCNGVADCLLCERQLQEVSLPTNSLFRID